MSKASPGSSKRTPEEVRDEFCSAFISGPVGAVTWREDDRGRARDHTQGNPLLPQQHGPNGASSNGSGGTEAPANLSLHESTMLGYMGMRDDFEVEFDNEAEALVAPLQCGINAYPDEDDVDEALKVAHVEMYKAKLRDRERRKRVAREHQLVAQYFKVGFGSYTYHS